MDIGTSFAPAAPEQTAPNLRILVASHSHPRLSNGGGEIAAYQHFRLLQAQPGCAAWFLGCDRHSAADRPGAVLTQPYGNDEFLYATGNFDWFKFANRNPRFPEEFTRLLHDLAPDIVHFHHYLNFGVEAFAVVKRALPDCRIVLTLHEYLAICHHYGQMVTKDHLSLCYRADPSACANCFSDIPKSDFFLRKLYIERFFNLVDQFVAPSQFLADRYAEWGVPAAKIAVLENLMPAAPAKTAAPLPASAPLRIGFFGQISALKGIDILFAAAEAVGRENANGVSFEIFGDYRGQPPEFQQAFLARLAKAGPNLRFHGPYDGQRVDRLMQSVDAILMPSIWWENSPVVIQEALRNRRPVICSDIGGMAEKIRDGIDGFHFAAGNAMALAALLRRLAADPGELAQLAGRMPGHPAMVSNIADYLDLYGRLNPRPVAAAADFSLS